MTTLATLLLPAMLTGVDVVSHEATAPAEIPARTEFAVVFYPPDDPEGPDDAGTGEGEGSGGSSGGTGE